MSLMKLLILTALLLSLVSPVLMSSCTEIAYYDVNIAGPMCVPESVSGFAQNEYIVLLDFALPILFVAYLIFRVLAFQTKNIGKQSYTRASLLYATFSLDVIHNPFDYFVRVGGLHRKITP